MEHLAEKLKLARQNAHLTQAQVASMVGLNKAAISTYETGTRRPSFEVLCRLASIYKVSVDYLFGLSESSSIQTEGLTAEETELIRSLIRIMEKKHPETGEK